MRIVFQSFWKSLASIASLALLFLAVGCQQRSPESTGADWDGFVKQFIESYFTANPTAAVNAGRHEFDGKLPDWTLEGLRKEVGRMRSDRERALAFDPAALDEPRRFEREYLLASIDARLFRIESAEEPYKNPTYYAGPLDPGVYLTRDYAPLAQRLRAYIAYARAVPAAAEQVRKNLRTPLPRTFADFGKNTFGGLASFYGSDVPKVFASVTDSQLQAEFRAANEAAIQAMKELQAWFEQQRTTATEAFALGPELFQKMLRDIEQVEVSLDQLEKIGREDLERNLAALREACSAYAPGKTIPECIAQAERVKPPGGPVEGARRQLSALKAFVVAKNLVTIPGTEEALVAEAPAYRRFNFAYIQSPGPYEKNLPSTYYIAPPDPSWSPQEQADYLPGEATLLFTSAHEVMPGHFLHRLFRNRSRSRFGQLFGTTAASEGWAHYTEEMMVEAGLAEGKQERIIGQRLQALLRDVRFLSAIGLHTGKMGVEESERMFREVAYSDPGNSRQQAARGTFDPAYLNYTLGKLMIRKLREDWTASRGGRAAWRAFHDQFLSYGAPPIPLVRRAMLGPNAGPAL